MFTAAHTTYFEELSRNASRVVTLTRRAAEFAAEDAAAYWEALFADGLLPPEYLPNARRVFPGYTPHGASNFEVFLNVCAKDEAARGLCPQVPRTVARAVAFVSLDPALVLRVEQLARDASGLDIVRWRGSAVVGDPGSGLETPEIRAIEAEGFEYDGLVAGGVQLAFFTFTPDSP